MMGENENFQEIKIELLTDDTRLHAAIPNYTNHQRLYFEDPAVFQRKQEEQALKERIRKAGGVGGKVREARVKENEQKLL